MTTKLGFKAIMTEKPDNVIPIKPPIQTFIPPSLELKVNEMMRKERARLVKVLSEIEVPAVSDHKTGAILEFPGFRPFLDDIINAIKSLDDVDNNW